MARTIPGWVVGTIVVGGLLILAATSLAVGSFFYFKGALREFEVADEAMEAVAERFGPVAEFRPAPAGAIPPDRMEAFLAVRDGTAAVRETTERDLLLLSGEQGVARAGAFRKFGAGLRLMHRASDFVEERSGLLMEVGMGLGEYYYLYTLAYFSWLEKSPADGPSFKLVGDNGYVLETVFEGLDEAEVREYRMEMTRTSLNRLLLPVLRNQLSDLPTDSGDDSRTEWRDTLVAEIAALESDDHRLPWQDGLPEAIASSMRPHRDALESTYSAMCNELEVGVARR